MVICSHTRVSDAGAQENCQINGHLTYTRQGIPKSLLEYYGYYALCYNTSTVARLMYLHNYKPFMSLYNTDENVFFLTAFLAPVSQQTVDQIHEMAVEYFKTL